MPAPVTTESVWKELDRHSFAVLGEVNRTGEARTCGILYKSYERKLYIATAKDAWKARHATHNPNVSMTVCIPRRLPFLPFIQIPAATITFNGTARVLDMREVPADVISWLRHGAHETPELESMCMLEVTPKGDFVTYGVGVSLLTMRNPIEARGRAPVLLATA